ncbi:hypothetical protein PFISCL1PPCAC_21014, partial [Pristionchus fissidentatus]
TSQRDVVEVGRNHVWVSRHRSAKLFLVAIRSHAVMLWHMGVIDGLQKVGETRETGSSLGIGVEAARLRARLDGAAVAGSVCLLLLLQKQHDLAGERHGCER